MIILWTYPSTVKKNKQPIFYQYKIFVILGCPLKTPKAPLLTIVREHAEGARPRTVRGGFPSIIYLARNRLISMFKSATKTIYIYTARLFLLATIDQLVLWKLLGKKTIYSQCFLCLEHLVLKTKHQQLFLGVTGSFKPISGVGNIPRCWS
jgi:hypothetical protein